MPTRPLPALNEAKKRRLRRLLTEKANRSMETLRLYKPLPSQLAFHRSTAPERLAIGGNRGGKTSSVATELAWILTGTHPYWEYPKEGGRCFVVGADGRHLSEVFFRKLFVAGAFKMIRDEQTSRWRWVDPVKDAHRKSEIKLAPPLIPSRFIQGGWKGISWENKRERIPSLIRMTNGWEIRFFPGGALPPNGVDVDVVAMDEEVPDIWYSEMSARLLDRKGRLMWSATPQAGTSTLLELHERAEKERTLIADGSLKMPNIQQFDMNLDSNPHIDDDQKRLLELKFRNDPQNYRIRILGEFIAKSYRMYPDFNEFVHGYSVEEFKKEFGHAEPPREWTRYMAVDPGHTCAAALLIAVPPPDLCDFVFAYDELYIYNCTAELFAQRAELKTRGQAFEAFIMDLHGGARREAGNGISIKDQYAAMFGKYKIRCHRTGSNFHWGNSDNESGCERVRSLLRIRDDGTPRLKLIRDKVPNFIMEMKKYRKKIIRNKDGTNTVTDAPDSRRDNHLCDCIRYLACYDLRYVSPKLRRSAGGTPLERYLAKKERRKAGQGGHFINLGPTRHGDRP